MFHKIETSDFQEHVMAEAAQSELSAAAIGPPLQQRPRRRHLSWRWVGVVPFFLFVVAFQLFPSLSIVVHSFLDQAGKFTFDNIVGLNQPIIMNSYLSTIKLSLISALWGGLLGFGLAWAVTIGGLPGSIRSAVMSFCGVAANFGGIPLAFAFIATIGRTGIFTKMLNSVGIPIYQNFTLYGFWGLCITYTYFQIPLMVLVLTPALDGLRREWREAAENLGASRLEYWRYVALPVLLPSILGALTLLFANAFGAQATAYALVGGGAGQNLVVTVMVSAQFSSDSFTNPGLGNALAFGMIVVIGLFILLYSWLRRRAERWQTR
jgi:putative spermidine/putrescine transport system permease protein